MPDGYHVGLIGYPVGHSRSPAMQQAAFDALGIAARYALWETVPEDLAARVASLRAPDMLGANVTIPYKTAVLPLMDELAETARLAGAANTIVRAEGEAGGQVRLIGHNTDVAGLRRALVEADAWRGMTAGRRVLLLGAGGAARAALAVALLEGAAVTFAARRVEAGRAVIGVLTPQLPLPAERGGEGTENAEGAKVRRGGILVSQPHDPQREHGRNGDEVVAPGGRQAVPDTAIALGDAPQLAAALEQTALLVNATPVGTSDPDAAPFALDLLARLPADAFVFDLVYSPPETALVRAARSRGLRASGGLPMLLYQGAEAFTLWTGQSAPVEVMRAALKG